MSVFDAVCNVSGKKHVSLDLCPEDFLDCEDEDELYDTINDLISDELYFGDLDRIYDSELSWNYPDGFLEDWKRYKEYD